MASAPDQKLVLRFGRYAQRALTEPIPKYELPEGGMDPDSVYQLIHDELLEILATD